MGKLRVAIVGVGNCASSLVQGVHFYAEAEAAAEQDPAGPPPAQLPQSPRDPRLPAQTG